MTRMTFHQQGHVLGTGSRLGIDVGGVLIRMGVGRALSRNGFRHGAQQWVKCMVANLGKDAVHIISRVSTDSMKHNIVDYLTSSGFLQDTGFCLDNIHFCRTKAGPDGKGQVFARFGLTHFVDDSVECLTDIRTTYRGTSSPKLYLVPTMLATGKPRDWQDTLRDAWLHRPGITAIRDLGALACGSRTV
jgi:hypothetical protein